MFWHNFKYRLKATLQAKEEVFWIFLFPLLLCTCFYVAFSGINDKTSVFHSIPVAVVYEKENDIFRDVLEKAAKSDSEGEQFLLVQETTREEADKLLDNEDVTGIITVNKEPALIVKQNGINQTAIQSFLNQYIQQEQMIKGVMANAENPDSINKMINTLTADISYIEKSSFSDTVIDPMSSYYYALIGMAVLFGGLFGLQIASQMKANVSPVGLRKCIVPVNRAIIIVSEFLAVFILHMISLIVLLAYMILVLKLEFTGQLGYIMLVCAVGSMFGISFGVFIGSIPKLKEGLRVALFLTFSLGSSFLAGLMAHNIKIALQQSMPIINRINPATLVQDALYSLLVYDTHERYFMNLATLSVMAIALCAVSYFMTRRESYASL